MKTFNESVYLKANHLSQTVLKKRRDYGTGNILKAPVSPMVAVLVRLNDKIERFAHLIEQGYEPSNESLADTAEDIMGYGMVLATLLDSTFELPLENQEETPEEVLTEVQVFVNQHKDLFVSLFGNKGWRSERTRATTVVEKELVLQRLARVWIGNPDLRLGQLLGNVFEDTYNVEDEPLISELEKFYEAE